MSLDMSYEPDNIFAKIIKGEIPCTKIYEDQNILSFMDLFPQSTGHALVISKQALAINLFDIQTADLHPLIDGVQKIGAAIRTSLKPDGIRVAQFNGAAAGQTVFHTHFHLIPVYNDTHLMPHGDGAQADPKELSKIAAKIRNAL